MAEKIKKEELKAFKVADEDLEKVSGGNDPSLFDDGIEKYKVAGNGSDYNHFVDAGAIFN